ncbi:hypothetical protein [Nocardia sp. NPDC003345]
MSAGPHGGSRGIAAGVLPVLLVLTACGGEQAGTADAQPVFAGIADSCAVVAAPVLDAVRHFTGPLFSDSVRFEDSSEHLSRPRQPVKVCRADYAATTPWTSGAPISRTITLSISLHLGDDAAGAAAAHFDRARENVQGSPTIGLGEESYAAWGAPADTATSAFRTGNAFVTAEVFGTNMSGREGIAGPRAAREELEPGAAAIGRALASGLGSVLTSR